ncbi:MAG: flavin-dependent oxidoreductase, partial [Rubritepida sp.]|nr:flavin-dependent oxidoreductase [Rubritepida sp.]
SLRMPAESRECCYANREGIFAPNLHALKQAFVDAGHAVPEMERLKLRERLPGD